MKSKLFAGLLLSTAMLAGLNGDALSAPIEFAFEPPTLGAKTKPVCAPHVAQGDMAIEWLAWDRKKIPKKSVKQIAQEIGQLRDTDAVKYRDIIARVIDLMPGIKKTYGPSEILIDKIKLFVATGETQKIRELGLVDQLLKIGTRTPQNKNTLADFVLQGLALGATSEQALQIKVEAALEGSPDAMLDLIERVEAGEKVPGWTIDSKLAVSLAYGTLIGELDSTVCDRIARVARDFESGKIVAKNISLAGKWFKLAADLGDTRSALKIAQYVLDGEHVPADAEMALKYLQKAANEKSDVAIVLLAGLYEEGALVDRDVDKAIALYDQAIGLNNPFALGKKVKLLAKLEQDVPQYQASYAQSLQQLVDTKVPPPWSVMRQSRLLQDREGFWTAATRSQGLLEQAANSGDAEAKIDLAELLIAKNEGHGERQRAVDMFAQVVKSDGDVRAVENLVKYYRCMDANPRHESYWSGIKNAMGNDTVEIEIENASALTVPRDSQKIAALQTQSLYGRGSAIAIFRRYLTTKIEAKTTQSFWEARVMDAQNGPLEEMYAEYKLHLKTGRIDLARAAIKTVNNDFNPDAGLTFARFLYENYGTDPAAIGLAKQILAPLADKGFGRAIQFIIALDPQKQVADFSDTMKGRGDMVAQLMLAETASSDNLRKLYLRRAEGIQRCDFNDAMTLGEYALRLDPSQAEKWLETAIRLAGENHWLKVKIADLYMSAGLETSIARALVLYRAGHGAKENSASYRLVKYYSDKARKDYNPRMASDIFVDLITRSDLKDVPERLVMLKNMKEEVRRQVSLRVNITDIYLRAAEARQPVAMREYGKILRGSGKKIEESFKWFLDAANLNDAESMFLVSQSYAFGMGVGASDHQAKVWLVKSANAGFAEAVKLRSYMTVGTDG